MHDCLDSVVGTLGLAPVPWLNWCHSFGAKTSLNRIFSEATFADSCGPSCAKLMAKTSGLKVSLVVAQNVANHYSHAGPTALPERPCRRAASRCCQNGKASCLAEESIYSKQDSANRMCSGSSPAC